MRKMRYGIPICQHPSDPKSMYMRNLYSTFFWGPFKDETAVIEAISVLDNTDSHWDYNPFCIIYGADPLPDDYVFGGFTSVDDSTARRIYASRKTKS